MDWSLAPRTEAALVGCRLERAALRERLDREVPEAAGELCRLLDEVF